MNGKFILIFVFILNLVCFSVSLACATDQYLECSVGDNSIIKVFIDEEKISNNAVASQTTGYGLSTEFGEKANSFQTAQSGVNPDSDGALTAFLDGLKIAFGMVSLLTPVPIIAFFSSMGMVWWLNVLISSPICLLYIFALMEFLRGGSF